MYPVDIKTLKSDEFEPVNLFGHIVMVTDSRIKRESLPEGYYAYEVRHSDSDWGEPVEIANDITCNFFGTIVTDKELPNMDKHSLSIIRDDEKGIWDFDYCESYAVEEDEIEAIPWDLESYYKKRTTDPYRIPDDRFDW